MGIENNPWKFELDPRIFLDFTGIWSLKYKKIGVSGAKLFHEYKWRNRLQSDWWKWTKIWFVSKKTFDSLIMRIFFG